MKLWHAPTFPLPLHGNVKEEVVEKREGWKGGGKGGCMECMEGEVSALFHIFRIAFIDPLTLANLPSQDSPNLRYPPPCRSN